MHTLWSNIYAKQIGCFNLFKAYMVSTPYILKAQDYNLLSLVSEITRTLLQRHFTQWVHMKYAFNVKWALYRQVKSQCAYDASYF